MKCIMNISIIKPSKLGALIIINLLSGLNCSASTWCTFGNLDVSITNHYVAVRGTTLDADGAYVLLGDLDTNKGKAIQAILTTAAIAGKSITYGDNSKNWACGALPAYSADTANPEYLLINTKN